MSTINKELNQKEVIDNKNLPIINDLINAFEDMAERGTLLTGEKVTQQDLLMQIIGTIIKVANEK